METLEELKDKYYKLDAERYDLFRDNKIRKSRDP